MFDAMRTDPCEASPQGECERGAGSGENAHSFLVNGESRLG
jgi:hypothetical protein